MKESIAAIKRVVQSMMIVAMLGVAWLGYKFATEPGYLAELTLGVESEDALPWTSPRFDPGSGLGVEPSGRVVTSRLPQASGVPRSEAGQNKRRLSNSSGRGSTTSAGSYAPRTSATGGLRTVSRKKETSAPAYAPPLAERKVIRVGE